VCEVTPVKAAEVEALPHLRDVYLWNLGMFRAWAQGALATIRELRRTFVAAGDLGWRAIAVKRYIEQDLDPEGLVRRLRARSAAEQLEP